MAAGGEIQSVTLGGASINDIDYKSIVRLTNTLTDGQLNSWGFRIPFIVGLLVGPVGLYIRRHMPESEEAARVIESAQPNRPIATLLGSQKLLVTKPTGVNT